MAAKRIGTDVCGSNVPMKHKRSKDGRKVYIELRSYFQNNSYKQNLAKTANKSIGEARYHGERRMFTLETYYIIMSKNFNLLEQAGVAHTLTEEQKVVKFEVGLKEEKQSLTALMLNQDGIAYLSLIKPLMYKIMYSCPP